MADSANNLDQIRELLFGQQLNVYETQFQECGDRLAQVEDTLAEFHSQIQLQLQQLEGTVSQELVNLNQGLENKFKLFSNASKGELVKVEQLLNGEMDSFTQELKTFERDFSQRYSTLKQELETVRRQLDQEVNSLKDSLLQEWDSRFGETNEGKLAKDQLGKMLFEFSLKTRDGSFLAELPPSVEEQIQAELES